MHPGRDARLHNVIHAQDLSFEKSVLPIFEAKCLHCHGEKKRKGGLDLRSKAFLIKGGENGASLKPGSLKDSLLWEKIRTDEMPEGEVKLSPAEKDLIRRWIEAGAGGRQGSAQGRRRSVGDGRGPQVLVVSDAGAAQSSREQADPSGGRVHRGGVDGEGVGDVRGGGAIDVAAARDVRSDGIAADAGRD